MKEPTFPELTKQPTTEIPQPKIELFKNAFSKFESMGVATDTWDKLQKALEEKLLSDKLEITLGSLDDLEIFVQDVEKKEDYEHFIEFINKHFQDSIMQLALVSAIHFRLNEVHLFVAEDNILNLDRGSYNIPLEIFEQQWQTMNPEIQSDVRKIIFRGESFSSWHIDGHTDNKYFPSPIVIYNQQYDEKNHAIENGGDLEMYGIEYLERIPPEKRKEAFVHGSLAHEIAHNIYVNLIYKTELEDAWRKIIDETGNITKYATEWEEKNSARDYNENFAEAIRLYTTDASYLQQKGYSEVAKFISDNFPEIKPSSENEQLVNNVEMIRLAEFLVKPDDMEECNGHLIHQSLRDFEIKEKRHFGESGPLAAFNFNYWVDFVKNLKAGNFKTESERENTEGMIEQFKKRLKGKILVDLGGGLGLMEEFAKEVGVKSYILVDLFLRGYEDKAVDPNINLTESTDINEDMQVIRVKADMLDFVRRLPDNSVNFVMNGIDDMVFYRIMSGTSEENYYKSALVAEIFRAMEKKGLFFGVQTSLLDEGDKKYRFASVRGAKEIKFPGVSHDSVAFEKL